LEECEDWNNDVMVMMGVVKKHKLIEKVVPAFLESSYASHYITSSVAVMILGASTTVNSSNKQ
jgi:hypothetical protein